MRYTEPEIEIIKIETEDIITLSGNESGGGNKEDGSEFPTGL